MNKLHQGGAALAELAIIVPVLLAIFFGVAETGRALVLHHDLVRQVDTTARYLARTYQGLNADCSTTANWAPAANTARQYAVYGNESGSGNPLISGMTTADVAIAEWSGVIPGYGNACVIQVSASVPYPGIFGSTIPLLGMAQPVLRADSEERYVGE
jgi:Flp pilus assembly protein TadG